MPICRSSSSWPSRSTTRCRLANEAVVRIRSLKTQIADRIAKASDATIKAAGQSLTDKLTDVEGEIYQYRNRSSQDPLNYPIRLNNKLAALQGIVESGDYEADGPVVRGLQGAVGAARHAAARLDACQDRPGGVQQGTDRRRALGADPGAATSRSTVTSTTPSGSSARDEEIVGVLEAAAEQVGRTIRPFVHRERDRRRSPGRTRARRPRSRRACAGRTGRVPANVSMIAARTPWRYGRNVTSALRYVHRAASVPTSSRGKPSARPSSSLIALRRRESRSAHHARAARARRRPRPASVAGDGGRASLGCAGHECLPLGLAACVEARPRLLGDLDPRAGDRGYVDSTRSHSASPSISISPPPCSRAVAMDEVLQRLTRHQAVGPALAKRRREVPLEPQRDRQLPGIVTIAAADDPQHAQTRFTVAADPIST